MFFVQREAAAFLAEAGFKRRLGDKVLIDKPLGIIMLVFLRYSGTMRVFCALIFRILPPTGIVIMKNIQRILLLSSTAFVIQAGVSVAQSATELPPPPKLPKQPSAEVMDSFDSTVKKPSVEFESAVEKVEDTADDIGVAVEKTADEVDDAIGKIGDAPPPPDISPDSESKEEINPDDVDDLDFGDLGDIPDKPEDSAENDIPDLPEEDGFDLPFDEEEEKQPVEDVTSEDVDETLDDLLGKEETTEPEIDITTPPIEPPDMEATTDGESEDGEGEPETADKDEKVVDPKTERQLKHDRIYRKTYSEQNKHLPRSRTASDLDAYFFETITRGELEGVRAFLDMGRDPNMQDEYGNTPLITAAYHNKADIAKLLLKRGAKPDVKNNQGANALHVAASAGRSGLVTALLEAGADPDQKTAKGSTPLMLAALAGDLRAVKSLLDKGASANIQDNSGVTALHIAAHSGRQDIVDLLLQNGASPSLTDREGLRAGDYAEAGRHFDLATSLSGGSYVSQPYNQVQAQLAQPAVVQPQFEAPVTEVQPTPENPYAHVSRYDDTSPVRQQFSSQEAQDIRNILRGGQGGEEIIVQPVEVPENTAVRDDWYDPTMTRARYETLPPAEQQKWWELLAGWIDADENFNNLSDDEKIYWNDRRKVLARVFDSHFTADNPQDQKLLDSYMRKWVAIDNPSVNQVHSSTVAGADYVTGTDYIIREAPQTEYMRDVEGLPTAETYPVQPGERTPDGRVISVSRFSGTSPRAADEGHDSVVGEQVVKEYPDLGRGPAISTHSSYINDSHNIGESGSYQGSVSHDGRYKELYINQEIRNELDLLSKSAENAKDDELLEMVRRIDQRVSDMEGSDSDNFRSVYGDSYDNTGDNNTSAATPYGAVNTDIDTAPATTENSAVSEIIIEDTSVVDNTASGNMPRSMRSIYGDGNTLDGLYLQMPKEKRLQRESPTDW